LGTTLDFAEADTAGTAGAGAGTTALTLLGLPAFFTTTLLDAEEGRAEEATLASAFYAVRSFFATTLAFRLLTILAAGAVVATTLVLSLLAAFSFFANALAFFSNLFLAYSSSAFF